MKLYRKGRVLRSILPALAAVALTPLPQTVLAQTVTRAEMAAFQRQISKRADKDLRPFYAAREFIPLWFDGAGRPSPAVNLLMEQLSTAEFDGVDAKPLQVERLAKLLDKARRGEEGNWAVAELELSRTLAAYVRAMRAAPKETMIYGSAALEPAVPTVRSVLDSASRVPLDTYVEEMRWMHPMYVQMRRGLTDPRFSEPQRRLIWTNLARIRAIPGGVSDRHVLVDAAGARLWMYENGRPVDSMKVVVGKPDLQTPMMAGFIRSAIVNPYWNVPYDLAQNNIAPNVLSRGVKYLKSGGYQVLSDWGEKAKVIDPKKVDWKAVRAGEVRVRVRQLPGSDNFMGKVKFMFPNDIGIYLHDTPDKHLLEEDARQLSSGCVRLEDAERFGRWLLNGPLPTSKTPEKAVPVADLVPVYITYLTAVPGPDGEIAFHSDPYQRDGTQLAVAAQGSARADRP